MKLGMLSMAALCGATVILGQGTDGQDAAQTQVPREVSETVEISSPTTSLKIETTTAVGRVTGFEAGKSVTIATPDNKTKKYDLRNQNTMVGGNPNVRVGQTVSITETTEANRRTVNIQPYAAGVRTDTATEAAIQQAQARASNEIPHVITREVKRSTPQGKTESKTTIAVGRVTGYQQGDRLRVTAPRNETKEFDLNKASVSGVQALQVGQTVKVTEVKQGDSRSISIQPITGPRS